MKLLAIDGNSIANRAFYGIKALANKKGEFTNAIYGFMNIYLKTIADVKLPLRLTFTPPLSDIRQLQAIRQTATECPKNSVHRCQG